MTGITNKVVELIGGFNRVTVPPAALHMAKIAIADTVGVALAGFNEPVATAVREMSCAAPAVPEAAVWGTSVRTSMLEAALVNGTTAHALDYDDQNRPMLGHPTSVLTPVLFAVGEKTQVSGRRVLEAYVLGLQVMGRLGRLIGPRAYDLSWHPTAVMGVIGAAATSAWLLGLNEQQTRYALGIAASEASSIKKNFGSMTKSLHVGSAARKGIWAALLAQRGLTANTDALDGRFGFYEQFAGADCTVGADDDWLATFELLDSGLVFKQYPCCGGLHAVVDVAMDLRAAAGDAAALQDIECRVHPQKVAYLDRPSPKDGLDAKFSIQYCVALALARGGIGLRDFDEAALTRTDVRSVMQKVRVVGDESLAGFASVVRIRRGDGRTIEGSAVVARGSPDVPLSEAELKAKFLDCAQVVLRGERAEALHAALFSLDKAADLSAVVKGLTA